MITDKLLTTSEVASILRVHPQTVRRWARTGVLSYVRVARRLLIRPTNLDALLDASDRAAK